MIRRPCAPAARALVAAAICVAAVSAQDSCDDNVTGHVYLAGIFDNQSAGYAMESHKHFTLAVEMINNHTDGVWDDMLPDAEIKTIVANSGCVNTHPRLAGLSSWTACISNRSPRSCSEQLGAPAYWSIRKWGKPLHGVVGARCSVHTPKPKSRTSHTWSRVLTHRVRTLPFRGHPLRSHASRSSRRSTRYRLKF